MRVGRMMMMMTPHGVHCRLPPCLHAMHARLSVRACARRRPEPTAIDAVRKNRKARWCFGDAIGMVVGETVGGYCVARGALGERGIVGGTPELGGARKGAEVLGVLHDALIVARALPEEVQVAQLRHRGDELREPGNRPPLADELQERLAHSLHDGGPLTTRYMLQLAVAAPDAWPPQRHSPPLRSTQPTWRCRLNGVQQPHSWQGPSQGRWL